MSDAVPRPSDQFVRPVMHLDGPPMSAVSLAAEYREQIADDVLARLAAYQTGPPNRIFVLYEHQLRDAVLAALTPKGPA